MQQRSWHRRRGHRAQKVERLVVPVIQFQKAGGVKSPASRDILMARRQDLQEQGQKHRHRACSLGLLAREGAGRERATPSRP